MFARKAQIRVALVKRWKNGLRCRAAGICESCKKRCVDEVSNQIQQNKAPDVVMLIKSFS